VGPAGSDLADRQPEAAAVFAKRAAVSGKRVGVLVSGGNMDLARFAALVPAAPPMQA
jgi:threonine dehydratase